MDIWKKPLTWALVFGTCAVAHAGSLGTTASCSSGTFTRYSQSGYTCALGPLEFFNFELYTVDAAGAATAADSNLLNLISIDPVWNATTGAATLTMGGFTELTVDSSHTRAWKIRYTVDPPPVVGGETMELDPPFGNITGTQSYCADGIFAAPTGCNGTPGTAAFGFHDPSVNTPASVTFGSPLATLDTLTTIRLNPGLTTASGFDGIVFSVQTVPEPAAFFLAGSALLLLGALRRRLV